MSVAMKPTIRLFIFSLVLAVSITTCGGDFVRIIGDGSNKKWGDWLDFWPTAMVSTDDGGFVLLSIIWDEFVVNDLYLVKLSSSGDIVWQKRYYDPIVWGDGIDFYTIINTSDGGFALTGELLEGEHDNACVLKLNSNGDIEWQRGYQSGFPGYRSISISQTSDGGFIIGGAWYDNTRWWEHPWVAKIDSSGNLEWQHAFGTTPPYPYDEYIWGITDQAMEVSDGGYIISGGLEYSQNYPDSQFCWFTMKLTPSGDIEWQKLYNCNADSSPGDFAAWRSPLSLYETSDHGLLFGSSKYDSSGNPLWCRYDERYEGYLLPASEGGYIGTVIYTYPEPSPLLKIYHLTEGDGTIQWEKNFHWDWTTYEKAAVGAVSKLDGSIASAGYMYGGGPGGGDHSNMVVVKTDENINLSDQCVESATDTPQYTNCNISVTEMPIPLIETSVDTITTSITKKNINLDVVNTFCPVIYSIEKLKFPFRLKIKGDNFDYCFDCGNDDNVVTINGVPVPVTKTKSSSLLIAKGGEALKAMLPKGQSVCIQVINTDRPLNVSPCFSFKR